MILLARSRGPLWWGGTPTREVNLLRSAHRLSNSLLMAILLCAANAPCGAAELYRCTRVIDGDTIELDKIGVVRLIGVDTPESAERSVFTRDLVSGKNVRLEYDKQRKDKYNRTLAYVFLEDSTFVNAAIISLGYGSAYAKYPFRYLQYFRELEREAKDAQRGLWGEAQAQTLGAPASGTDTSETVYVTSTGTKYHRAGCRYLARSMIPIDLSNAVQSYGPCSHCRPSTIRRTPQRLSNPSSQQRATSYAGRCQATTQKGTQCKRNAKTGSSYCWQHAE
jgi:micrococcal nuclease